MDTLIAWTVAVIVGFIALTVWIGACEDDCPFCHGEGCDICGWKGYL